LSARAITQPAGRATALLIRILRDRGRVSLPEQAGSLGIPVSTAYRLAGQLHRAGLICRVGRGYFSAGLELARLTTGVVPLRVTTETAAPHLQRLALRLGLTVHLGVIEDDMVTYLSKVHGGGPDLFTRGGTQLEAYYSAIGKVLLAALPDSQLDRYLGVGPFIALTSNTISAPEELRRELIAVRSVGYATDAEEACENLRCIAVPVQDRHSGVVAAISAARSLRSGHNTDEGGILRALRDCARRIEADL
jgi:DNA-binding IclR family transcriptional regulator